MRKHWELEVVFGSNRQLLIPVDPANGDDMLEGSTKGGIAFGFRGQEIVPYDSIQFDPENVVGTDGVAVGELSHLGQGGLGCSSIQS